MLYPSTASRWLSSIYSSNKLRPITAHGFRHTHCTLALQSRHFTVPEVMHRLGHKDIKVTMQVYTHVTAETMENNTDLYLDYLKTNIPQIPYKYFTKLKGIHLENTFSK
ncbi:tyrosine-type recombinase/integrase [Lysinibacillus fusiformis]|uniref:tyrosine-type recombinase/integrase n=1 Tax=Lysinibacillus fusiformis TaxID=28031 RepID=UPI0018800C96|nr:tyrosine-type recombinase/integrase [Lysinibacillus fusiformis]MBD8522744.1 tyrosine-type recombinase/integrase [Lysinibacillus fusiformis]